MKAREVKRAKMVAKYAESSQPLLPDRSSEGIYA